MTAIQPDLFSSRETADCRIGHTDPRLPEVAKARLGGQNAAILARLRCGAALNTELEAASGSHRINSRIADVRRYLRELSGETVLAQAVDTKAGVYRYEIVRAIVASSGSEGGPGPCA